MCYISNRTTGFCDYRCLQWWPMLKSECRFWVDKTELLVNIVWCPAPVDTATAAWILSHTDLAMTGLEWTPFFQKTPQSLRIRDRAQSVCLHAMKLQLVSKIKVWMRNLVLSRKYTLSKRAVSDKMVAFIHFSRITGITDRCIWINEWQWWQISCF